MVIKWFCFIFNLKWQFDYVIVLWNGLKDLILLLCTSNSLLKCWNQKWLRLACLGVEMANRKFSNVPTAVIAVEIHLARFWSFSFFDRVQSIIKTVNWIRKALIVECSMDSLTCHHTWNHNCFNFWSLQKKKNYFVGSFKQVSNLKLLG